MVLAGERAWQLGGESVRGIQRPDSGRGCRHLRSGAEEPALPQLLAGTLQRDTGKRRARVPSDVCGMDGRDSPRISSRKRRRMIRLTRLCGTLLARIKTKRSVYTLRNCVSYLDPLIPIGSGEAASLSVLQTVPMKSISQETYDG